MKANAPRVSNLSAIPQFRAFVSTTGRNTRRVRGGDREAIGANNKGSGLWGILNRKDLCSPGLRFRRFFRPRGSNVCAFRVGIYARLARKSTGED